MRSRVMFSERILVVKVQALAEVAVGVGLADVCIERLFVVDLLLEHQDWLEL